MGYKLITGPTTEPITNAEARQHLKTESDTAENALIDVLIKAAREIVEQYTNRALFTQTWELRMDEMVDDIYLLEKTPVQSISHVKYYDQNNVLQTMAATYYQLNTGSEPHSIGLQDGQTWPTGRGWTDDVRIQFIAGDTTTANIPAALKAAMLLIIGHLYANREDVISGKTITEIPMGSKYLMDPYRIFRF